MNVPETHPNSFHFGCRFNILEVLHMKCICYAVLIVSTSSMF